MRKVKIQTISIGSHSVPFPLEIEIDIDTEELLLQVMNPSTGLAGDVVKVDLKDAVDRHPLACGCKPKVTE